MQETQVTAHQLVSHACSKSYKLEDTQGATGLPPVLQRCIPMNNGQEWSATHDAKVYSHLLRTGCVFAPMKQICMATQRGQDVSSTHDAEEYHYKPKTHLCHIP